MASKVQKKNAKRRQKKKVVAHLEKAVAYREKDVPSVESTAEQRDQAQAVVDEMAEIFANKSFSVQLLRKYLNCDKGDKAGIIMSWTSIEDAKRAAEKLKKHATKVVLVTEEKLEEFLHSTHHMAAGQRPVFFRVMRTMDADAMDLFDTIKGFAFIWCFELGYNTGGDCLRRWVITHAGAAVESSEAPLIPKSLADMDRLLHAYYYDPSPDMKPKNKKFAMEAARLALAKRKEAGCRICGKPTINKCAFCRVSYYCSVKCQALHWKEGGHKLLCPTEGRQARALAKLAMGWTAARAQDPIDRPAKAAATVEPMD